MADALGTQWRRAGHEVRTGGRRDGGLRAAAEHGTDAVLPALPYEAVVDVVAGLADVLRGRTLIDCTNPVGPGFTLRTGGGPSAAERIAAAAPALSVVRRLVRDLGCVPLSAGGLERAGIVEATAALLIGLWVGEEADAQAIAPPLEYAGPRG